MITKPRNSPAYDQGVRAFLVFAFGHGSVNDTMICPCPMCGFSKCQTLLEVFNHLIYKQFWKGYTIWYLHGESHPQEMNYVSNNDEVGSQRMSLIKIRL